MHNPESVLDNETYKLLWGFEVQTDHLVQTTRLYNNHQKRENFQNCGLCKIEKKNLKNQKRDKYHDIYAYPPLINKIIYPSTIKL